MNQVPNEPMVEVGTLDFHVTADGLDTVVSLVATSERGVVAGHGKARCRKDDHYDLQIGLDIAAGRAMQDLGAYIENVGLSASQTERQFQNGKIAQALHETADAFTSIMDRIARAVTERE